MWSMCSTSSMYLWRRFRSAGIITLSPTRRGAAKQDHWPAILLGIGEAGETVHHAGAGHNDAGAGAAGQIAVGLRRVGGGLFVAHADIGNAFLLRGCGNRGDRKPDDPEQVIDALLFEAPRYQGRADDFAHAFLLVLQARDYALMARPRKGFALGLPV